MDPTAFILAFALQSAAPATAETPGQLSIPVPQLATAKGKPEKMICKRQVRTGTLAGVERTCYTRAEWQRLASHTREAWQEIQGIKGSTNNGQ